MIRQKVIKKKIVEKSTSQTEKGYGVTEEIFQEELTLNAASSQNRALTSFPIKKCQC